ncbi:HTH-type transcriptional repressor AcnR [Gordonia polyisoprenivorans VH2]|uniref:HTH-type transcriptional repressor AcnR n=1 Tax=Gordonia polyisoprenivorans (strain DSM 44266 / VH2) TaxID=1112204 RepID=H6N1P4_GORPV|nr:TetR/AcrR family transcriptional regulator [Gordonia polyisoprenivorans]AFA73363.1 HTH-type transcriptional repressor AcnR [Gordonia polyisoprenivorans VH2]MBE7195897.1 TetR/AcrR family transcriptional regulator [Gordonia polyisoprenivorans]OZC30468.1 TetR/AcrR family transcriptional regulator [Gordonia polyisoprenivorans]UZF58799.1 TetR/AcrR family transcriptional regulator [Gordonia polyisoprenivorans]HCS56000.1 TetR/AcrR family transcriptional regulator [Gordonia polyisoprenivorans]
MPKVSDDRLAARRREILDGARHCFAEYGYDGATVKRIEESTGLSRGAIFHHFRDKEALFLALASEDAERMADVAAEQGLVQVMRDVLARPQDFNWLGTRLEIARKLRTDKSFRDAWMSHSADVEKATLARLERGRASGRLRDDVPAEVLVKYLDLVLDGLITRLATGQPTDDLHDVLDLVEESVRVSRGAPTGPVSESL